MRQPVAVAAAPDTAGAATVRATPPG
jgi:hypothetical protein